MSKINLLEYKNSVSNLTRKAFLRQGYTSKSETRKIIGCDWLTLKKFIESQFDDEMDWNNRGRNGWHVDHIIPLSAAKTKKEMLLLTKYINLQPMWSKDNLRKNAKLIYTDLPDRILNNKKYKIFFKILDI